MSSSKHTHKDSIRQHLLVIRSQIGDENAFFELYTMYSERTLRYLKSLLDSQTAEDVHQEVWLKCYQKISTLTNVKGFRTWLYRMTRNRAIDYLRKSKRQSELSENLAEEITESYISETDDESLDIETKNLEVAMRSLSATHRDVLILKYWDEMSYEQISLIVGCSVGTIRSRIYNAKQNLKEKLNQDSQSNYSL